MITSTNRRAILAGATALAASTAAGAIADPVVAMPQQADAAILDLGQRLERVRAEFERVMTVEERAEDRLKAVTAKPDILRVRPMDCLWFNAHLADANHHHLLVGDFFSLEEIDVFATTSFSYGAHFVPRPSDSLPADATVLYLKLPLVEAQTRADEIIAAFRDWKEDYDRRYHELGLDELAAQRTALSRQTHALARSVLREPATTLSGLALKMRAASWYCDLDERESGEEDDVMVLCAIARDVERMAERIGAQA